MMGPYEIAGVELPGWAALYLMHRSLDAINDPINVGPQGKNKSTLLHLAILRAEPVDEIENLILLGARLGARDSSGDTPLDMAEFVRERTLSRNAIRTWHLISKYDHRQRRCFRSIIALYACLRYRGICKDVTRLVAHQVWAKRHSHAWS